MLSLRHVVVLLCLSVSVHGWSKAITKAEKDDGGFNFRNNGYVTRCLPLVGSLPSCLPHPMLQHSPHLLLPTRKWPWPGVTAATKYGPAELPFGTQASPDAPLPTTSHKNGENKAREAPAHTPAQARETAHSGPRKGSSGLRHNLETMVTLR